MYVSLCIQQQTGNKQTTNNFVAGNILHEATCCLKQHFAGNKQHVAGQHVALV